MGGRIGGKQVDAFGRIQNAAAADGDDAVDFLFYGELAAIFDFMILRVR